MTPRRDLHQDTDINQEIADRFIEAASLLERRDSNRFRVEAYVNAANTLIDLDRDISKIAAKGGRDALVEIPTIGDGIAGAIVEIVETGSWRLLDRLREDLDPVTAFQTLPGIGPALAAEIHEALDVENLEELEVAANDGRLRDVRGIGDSRADGIRAALAAILKNVRGRRRSARRHEPDIETILEIDHEYRRKAAAGALATVAPRRHNPDAERWLPVLRRRRGPWGFTVMFSNSARAHILERTRDWVVISYSGDDGADGQVTVVTERRGPMASRRVVRGRELECKNFFNDNDTAAIER